MFDCYDLFLCVLVFCLLFLLPTILFCFKSLNILMTHFVARRGSFRLQGSPEFVAVSQCVHYFEWRTYSACKNNKFMPQKEVGERCGKKK